MESVYLLLQKSVLDCQRRLTKQDSGWPSLLASSGPTITGDSKDVREKSRNRT